MSVKTLHTNLSHEINEVEADRLCNRLSDHRGGGVFDLAKMLRKIEDVFKQDLANCTKNSFDILKVAGSDELPII